MQNSLSRCHCPTFFCYFSVASQAAVTTSYPGWHHIGDLRSSIISIVATATHALCACQLVQYITKAPPGSAAPHSSTKLSAHFLPISLSFCGRVTRVPQIPARHRQVGRPVSGKMWVGVENSPASGLSGMYPSREVPIKHGVLFMPAVLPSVETLGGKGRIFLIAWVCVTSRVLVRGVVVPSTCFQRKLTITASES